jgi:hypothetical protein
MHVANAQRGAPAGQLPVVSVCGWRMAFMRFVGVVAK